MYQKFYMKIKSMSSGFQNHVGSLGNLRGETKTTMLKQMNNFQVKPPISTVVPSSEKKLEQNNLSKNVVKKNFLEDIMKRK